MLECLQTSGKIGTFGCELEFVSLSTGSDLSGGVPRGIVEIRNTESRISELVNSIGQCLEASRLDRGTAEKLRGRLGFAENHVFGRAGVLA